MDGSRSKSEPIAIVGMACRFPGADTPQEYWSLLHNGREAISDVSVDRWDIRMFDPSGPVGSGQSSTRKGGFVNNIDQFDPYFFSISPREAIRMDPQQRMLLEVSWEALEAYGHNADKLAGSLTGVFIGMMSAEYSSKWNAETDQLDVYDVPGNTYSIASNRLSYQLDFTGPSMTIDTACSSSLVTTHLACQSLRNGECDMALSGGVNAVISPYATAKYYKMGMLSPDARCKTFDASANGYVRADGCGIVVLKRLSDAISSGDKILAVIRGSAINQNGRGEGLTAPNGDAQQRVIRSALRNAGVKPADIAYVEAHGTGTRLGDPTEALALKAVLGHERSPGDRCFLGSAKTNIGHAESAAGIAGMIKAVLCLCNEEIPPHLHLNELNPALRSLTETFHIPVKCHDWPRSSRPRLASVNSFGFGGANAHIIIEESPPREERDSECERTRQLLSLSAQTETALLTLVQRFSKHLEQNPTLPLAQVCYSANVGRRVLSHRLAVCSDTLQDLTLKLKRVASGEPVENTWKSSVDSNSRGKVVFLFTGQGSQYVGMARELYESQAGFRATLEECSALLEQHLEGKSLLEYLYPSAVEHSRLNETWLTQPALFAVEYALAKLWMSWGVKPDAMLGHSVGEYVAACIAGVFNLEEGLALVSARARLMNSLPSGGGMAAVMANHEQIEELLLEQGGKLGIAAYNGPELVTVTGLKNELEQLYPILEQRGIRYQRLSVSHAFHSYLMEPMLVSYREVLEKVNFQPAQIPIAGNVHGAWWSNGDGGTDYWLEQIRSPVQFEKGMRLLSDESYKIYVEIGPNATLLGMARGWISSQSIKLPSQIPGKGAWEILTSSLAQLYIHGVDIDWSAYDQGYIQEGCRYRVPLPTYPFERQRCWYEPEIVHASDKQEIPAITSGQNSESCFGDHPLIDECPVKESDKETIFRKNFSTDQIIIREHRVRSKPLLPGVAYLEMVIAAVRFHTGSMPAELRNITIASPLEVDEGEEIAVSLSLRERSEDSELEFRIMSDSIQSSTAGKTLHAAGEVHRNALSVIPGMLEIQAIVQRCHDEMRPEQVYQCYHQLEIDYQPYFRSIQWLKTNDHECIGLLQLPASSRRDKNYILHPSIMDGAMQVMGALFIQRGMSSTYVPFAMNRVHIFRELGDKVYCHVETEREEQSSFENKPLLRANIRLSDEKGHILVVMEGVSLKQLPQVEMAKQDRAPELDKKSQQLLFEPSWRALAINAPVPWKKCRWLLFMDDYGVGAALMYQLQRRGDECIVVEPAQHYKYDDTTCFINPSREEDYRKMVFDLSGKGLLPSGVIHLWRCGEAKICTDSTEQLKIDLDHGVYSLFFLARSLMTQTKQDVRFVVVTSYGQAIEGSAQEYIQPDKGAMWGFSKVLPREYSRIRCSGVDLETRGYSVVQLANTIIDEIAAESPVTHFESWVVYRGGERLVSTLIPVDGTHARSDALPLRDDGVYLITGGQGGIGLEIARFIAGKVRARFVLVNRTPLDENLHPDRVEGIRALEALGSVVITEACDVTDKSAMRSLVDRTVNRWGGLHGVVHSAGVLHDGLIPVLERDQFSKVLHPKVYGSWVLDEVTSDHRPEFFLICSSMITLLTPPGQCNHVAACGFEDSFAYYRNSRRKLRTLVMNWGLWGETGVVSSAVYQKALKAKGLHAMTNAEGIRGLDWSLTSGLTRVVCGGVELSEPGIDEDYKLPASAFSEPESISNGAADGGFGSMMRSLRNRLSECEYKPVSDNESVVPVDVPLKEASLAYMVRAFKLLGWRPLVGDRFTASDLMQELRVETKHERYFVHLLGLLVEDGILQDLGSVWEVIDPPVDIDAEAIGRRLVEDYPAHRAELVLFIRCASSLAESLRGDSDALQLLFPDGSLDISREFYTKSPFSVFCNRVARNAMEEISRNVSNNRKLNILEVGGGTGGTTTYLLPGLDKNRSTYVFTDLSNYFLNKARDSFEKYPFVDYRILNAEVDPEEQGYKAREFDVVVAAHVLHATKDLRETLGNIQKLMAPEGILILLESFESQRLLDLIFGSTEGWWRFTDLELRPQHALISFEKWKSLLLALGFEKVECIYSDGGVASNQAVLFAQMPKSTDVLADMSGIDSVTQPAQEDCQSEQEVSRKDNDPTDQWLQDKIIGQIAHSLRVPTERIQRQQNFSELGVDSLIGVEIIGSLKQELGIELGPTLLFEYPTVAALSRYLAEEFGAQLSKSEDKVVSSVVEKTPTVKQTESTYSQASMAGVTESNSREEQARQWILGKVVDQIAQSLRVPAERIKPQQNFSEIGVDSLVGVEIIGALKQTLGVSLGPTLLFEYPTVAALSRYLVDEFGENIHTGEGGSISSISEIDRKQSKDSTDNLSPEDLLCLYEALPLDYRGLVDRAASAGEANGLILKYSSGV